MNPQSSATLRRELNRICRIIDNAEIGRAPESYIDARLAVQGLFRLVDDVMVTDKAEAIANAFVADTSPGIGKTVEPSRTPKNA